MAKKLESSIVFSDFFALLQEIIGMTADMPIKCRSALDGLYVSLSVEAFDLLFLLKLKIGVPSEDVVKAIANSIKKFQLFFQMAIRFGAVAAGRLGQFIESSEFVLRKIS